MLLPPCLGRVTGLASGNQIFHRVLGAAVLHRRPVVNLACDREAAGIAQLAEGVDGQLALPGHLPTLAGVEAVSVAGLSSAGSGSVPLLRALSAPGSLGYGVGTGWVRD